jgi:hypothetical protein
LAYDTPGKSNIIVLTDLKSGKNHTLDEAPLNIFKLSLPRPETTDEPGWCTSSAGYAQKKKP